MTILYTSFHILDLDNDTVQKKLDNRNQEKIQKLYQ